MKGEKRGLEGEESAIDRGKLMMKDTQGLVNENLSVMIFCNGISYRG